MKPFEASLFKPLPADLKKALILSNVCPVNDAFLPLWGNKNKLNLLYGSYGSGKSVFIVDDLINHAINDEYFRCYFGRKVLDKVRGSVFKTITDRIKELRKAHLFSFSDAPNGTMIIGCKKNGNEFYPFGCDDSDSLLSIKDPSHFFCEEFNQFTFSDFGDIYSRLRTQKADTQFWGSFNTEKIYHSHWIRKVFWDGEFKEQSFKHKSTFRDNYFIDQEDYYKKLELIANGDPVILNSIANAEWGVLRDGHPFIFRWHRKFITPGLQAIPHLPIILSWDFNVEPNTCLVGQVDGFARARILDEYRLMNSDPEEICERILCDYPDKMFLVTGDASGMNRIAAKRELNSYKGIKQVLRLGMGQFKVPSFNPRIKNTRILCNQLLARHADYQFSDRVPYLIMDIEETQADEKGGIDESKDKHKGHLFACWRYFNWTFLHKFVAPDLYDHSKEADVHSEGS